MLPVLAHKWDQAIWGVHCGPAGGGGAGGLCSQDTQRAGVQGAYCVNLEYSCTNSTNQITHCEVSKSHSQGFHY